MIYELSGLMTILQLMGVQSSRNSRMPHLEVEEIARFIGEVPF